MDNVFKYAELVKKMIPSSQVERLPRYKGTSELMHECEFVIGFSRNGIHVIKDRNSNDDDKISFQEFLYRLKGYSTYLGSLKPYESFIRIMESKIDSLKYFL